MATVRRMWQAVCSDCGETGMTRTSRGDAVDDSRMHVCDDGPAGFPEEDDEEFLDDD